jgi:hypothetical protein
LGVDCYRRLRAVATFPIDPKRTFLEQLRKLAGLQQSLNNIVRLFPGFVEKRITRQYHNLSNQKRAQAGTSDITANDIQDDIAHGTRKESILTTYREPALHRTKTPSIQGTPHCIARHDSAASIELPRRTQGIRSRESDQEEDWVFGEGTA